MSDCTSPIAWERLVDYWAGELVGAALDATEEHLFACASCADESARAARIVQAFRSQLPVTLTTEQVGELRGRGLVVDEGTFRPAIRQEAVFRSGVDVLVLHLGGLDLAEAERVHVTIRSESAGVLFEDPFAEFDRDRGEVLIACQRHFSAFPPDVAFDVRAHRSSGPATMATFLVPHVFVG